MTPHRLLTIVPTRGRPAAALELAQAHAETTSDADLVFAVDDDDPTAGGYLRIPTELAKVRIGGRLRLGPTLNAVAREALDPDFGHGPYEVLAFMGDDHRPRTPGWDRTFLELLDELGPGFVYGDDLLMGATIPTAVAVSADIVAELGYFSPPGLVHLNIDVAWRDLGEAIGRLVYRPDVIIEHLHPAAGKALIDPGYEECNSELQVASDAVAYAQWRDFGFPDDVAKLQRLLVAQATA